MSFTKKNCLLRTYRRYLINNEKLFSSRLLLTRRIFSVASAVHLTANTIRDIDEDQRKKTEARFCWIYRFDVASMPKKKYFDRK